MKNVLDEIIRYSLYLLVFLLPLFFLPFGGDLSVAINEQLFIAAVVFFLVLLGIFKTISSGKIIYKWSKISSAVSIFLLVLGLSTLLSKSKIQSFWGMNFEPDTFFSFLLYGLGFFIFSNLVDKYDILKIFLILVLALAVFAGSLLLTFAKNSFDIGLGYRATLDTAIKTVGASSKNFVLGSGPATFAYNYDRYFSKGAHFPQGASFFFTIMSTTGLLGVLAVLTIMGVFFRESYRSFGKNRRVYKTEKAYLQIALALLFIFWFGYPINFSLMFLNFLILGLFVNLTAKEKKFVFISSPRKNFFTMLVLIFLIGLTIVGYLKISKIYIADIKFNQGFNLIINKEPGWEKGIVNLVKAANLNSKDVYLRNLSQIYLFQIKELLKTRNLDEEIKKQALQKLVSRTEAFIKSAVLINPANSLNWIERARVYEFFMAIEIKGARELALSNWQKAKELAPFNLEINEELKKLGKAE